MFILKGNKMRKAISPRTGKPLRKYTKRAKKAKPNTVRQYDADLALLGKVVTERDQLIDKLTARIKELESNAVNLKVDMLDQQAVINYLEKKLLK